MGPRSKSPLLGALLHPVRMRIVAELAGRTGMTAGELGAVLRDVPAATLYRQLSALESAGVIRVVETREPHGGRGPAERVFALPDPKRGAIALGDAIPSPRAVQRLFAAFVAMMVGHFARYTRRARSSSGAAPFFRGWPVYATDREFVQLTRALEAFGDKASLSAAKAGRRRRFLYIVTVPDAEGA